MAVLAVVVAGTVLLGTCALLLTDGQEDALRASLLRGPAADLVIEASAQATGGAPQDVVGALQGTTAAAFADLDPELSTWLTSPVRYLRPVPPGAREDVPAATYVSSADDLAGRATLVAGRWPAAPADGVVEAALPSAAAELLGVSPGSTLVLRSTQRDTDGASTTDADAPLTVTVVGTFAPVLDDGAWDLDLLAGAGHDPAWERPDGSSSVLVPAYGPLAVDPAAFLDATVPLGRVDVHAHPRLMGDLPASSASVRTALDTLETDIRAQVGVDATEVRVRSELAATVRTALTRQQVTGAVVLVVAVVGSVLAAAALGLAALLVAGRRASETALVSARGAGRPQLAGQALAESLVLAALAAVLAVPGALLLYGWIVRAPVLASAGLRAPTTPTPALVVTVAAGCLALVAVLVLPALRRPDHHRGHRATRRGAVARSSADLVLLALAVVGFLQLRSHTVVAGAGTDPVLVAAPVLCLLAGAALALRLLPLVASLGERGAGRSRRLVGPLAAWEVSRRTQATGTAFLLVLATAAGTFGIALSATWSHSQQDQADALVGADLTVATLDSSLLAQSAALVATTGGEVLPVTDRAVQLGALSSVGSRTELGEPGTGPQLVAVDSRGMGALRGRAPDGTSWTAVAADLAATTPADAIPVATTGQELVLTVTGSVTGGAPVTAVVPTVVVETAGGHREALEGTSVPLDDRTHDVSVTVPSAAAGAPGLRVVAVGLQLAVGERPELPRDALSAAQATLAVTFPDGATTSGTDGGPAAGSWSTGTTPTSVGQVTASTVRLSHDGTGTTVTTEASLTVPNLASRLDLQLDSFESPPYVPVLLTEQLADAIAAGSGSGLSLGLGNQSVAARVVGTVPYVPSAPRGPAVLVDYDALSRALLAQGALDTLTDRWIVSGTPDPAAVAARIVSADLGIPTTAAQTGAELREGPSQALVPVVLRLLVGAAVLLALAGTALHTAATVEARAIEVARLQGVGVPRRTVATAIVLERAVVSLVSVAAGVVVGGVVARVVGPLLVVSEGALVPVPAVLARWPWPEQGMFVGALVLGSAAVVVPVAVLLLRRATTAHLRMDSAS